VRIQGIQHEHDFLGVWGRHINEVVQYVSPHPAWCDGHSLSHAASPFLVQSTCTGCHLPCRSYS
jgi:hypothetical protein